ncbi:plasmid partitioning protein RepB [Xinfangfangia sp. D13-10-4-6]|uniref:plasmid partitioning protein RepB n=1 Tax=Pseudogemmobacter hezensis TaxID=2737662 RepID=UPI00155736F4|nr:plasmid partitioning protein RepB [Pseudogemmobacter hezensis]NPD15123.1 plasmid partitioning protein RepB [Pseudogemmobacter hezensis]
MARKIRFEIAGDETGSPLPQQPPMSDAPSKAPSLSAMAKSLHAAAASSIREIETKLIDESQFKDRIADDDPDVIDLANSIREQGQLIPILVSPSAGGRFRIVYGRRRLAALRSLDLPAKALVRDLEEDEAIIAQGQENTFRKDLSWIEKALFAKQLDDAGKSDELICDALNIDQKARRSGEKLTGLSRMRQVMSKLDHGLVDAVGPAHKVGRDRWYRVAQMIEKAGFPPGNQREFVLGVLEMRDRGAISDDRFDELERMVSAALKATSSRQKSVAPQSAASRIGIVRSNTRSATITVTSASSQALHQWISTNPEQALLALVEAQKKTEQQQ